MKTITARTLREAELAAYDHFRTENPNDTGGITVDIAYQAGGFWRGVVRRPHHSVNCLGPVLTRFAVELTRD